MGLVFVKTIQPSLTSHLWLHTFYRPGDQRQENGFKDSQEVLDVRGSGRESKNAKGPKL